MVQWLTNPTRNHEVAGLVPALAQCGLRIGHCRELWCRSQMQDAAWILRCCGSGVRSPVATAPIRPLAWEPPYAAGAAQEIAKRQINK